MMHATRTAGGRIAGSYDLVGVNGSVLPVAVDDASVGAGEDLRCRILAGELRLEQEGSYRLALTARYEAAAAAYTRIIESQGRWRFLASALDELSGELDLHSQNGRRTSAALTRLSLVHRTRVRSAAQVGMEYTWVYLRRGPLG